ncbi:MAG: chemotaxis protein CheB, partial [Rubrivivax sp.]
MTPADDPQPASFPVVGIGASAGGLEACVALLRALPAHTGMAFVVIQHLDPTYDSQLRELLSRSTEMAVVDAADGMVLAPDQLAVIRPNTSLAMGPGHTLRVTPRPPAHGPHLPVDHFFKSLAQQLGHVAVGVVLSGTGSDGTLGLEACVALLRALPAHTGMA